MNVSNGEERPFCKVAAKCAESLSERYRELTRENAELSAEFERLRLSEPRLDARIAEQRQRLADLSHLRQLWLEGELFSAERLQRESDRRYPPDSAFALLRNEIENDDELALFYLRRYLARLKCGSQFNGDEAS